MRIGIGISTALLVGLSSGVPVDPASAGEPAIPSMLAREGVIPADSWSQASKMDRSPRAVRSSAVDWGTGGLSLQGERTRAGSKREQSSATSHDWHRSIAAGINVWQALSPDFAIVAGARLEKTRSGFVGGPLLSRQTSAVSREAFVTARGPGRTGLELAVFDLGGWTQGEVGPSVNRMVNGEARARKGAALTFGLLAGTAADDDMRLSLRFARALSPGFGAESSTTLAFKVRF